MPCRLQVGYDADVVVSPRTQCESLVLGRGAKNLRDPGRVRLPTAVAAVLGRSRELPKESDTIWLVHASTGRGHQKAAEAVASALAVADPPVPVRLLDVLDLCDWPLAFGFRAGYAFAVTRATRLYRRLYYRWETPRAALASPLLRFALPFAGRLTRTVSESGPSLAISTHFLATHLLGRLRAQGLWDGALWEVITDFRPHGFQVLEGVERYLVPTPDASRALSELGVEAGAAVVTGIPCSEEFLRASRGRLDAAHRLGPARVLFSGHGIPEAKLAPWVARLAHSPEVRLVVYGVASRRLRTRLSRATAAAPNPVEVLGPVEDLPRRMAGSDLLVSKAGGLTCTEAMQAGLPTVLCLCYPGQEEENRDYLVAQGAAARADHPDEILRLVGDPAALEALASYGHRAAPPGAARRIAALALDRLGLGLRAAPARQPVAVGA